MSVTARAILDRYTSEESFQDWITDLATTLHLPWFHDEDARRDNAGLPDLIIPAGDTLLILELKTMKGRLRPDQQIWADALSRCTKCEYRLLRPTEDDRRYVEAKLRAGWGGR